MADGFLEIYIAANLLGIALFAIGGAGLRHRNRLRGALVGLVLGALIAPVATNLLFFDNPEVRPIPKLVVGQ